MTNESDRFTPESRKGIRLSILQLLQVDFEDARELHVAEESFSNRDVYIRQDLTAEDQIPRKIILLTEKGEKLGKSLLKTDRYYISTIDEDAFPTGGSDIHSGLERTEIRHFDEEGKEQSFYITSDGFIDSAQKERSALSKILPQKNEITEGQILDQLRVVLTDYVPTPFPAFDE